MNLNELTPIDLALYWASKGHRVLPVIPMARQGKDQKRPWIKAWQDNCTTDETTIRGWWAQRPDSRVGIATGDPGFDVVDFDVAGGKPGMEQLDRLIEAGVLVPGTFYVVNTPSGGRHLLFEGSQQRNKQNEATIPGVDFRGQGGMILAPGNPGYVLRREPDELGLVSWEKIRAELAPADTPAPQQAPAGPSAPPPAPVRSAAVGRPRTRLQSPDQGYEHAPGEESPLDWFVRNNDLEAMIQADGWTFAYEAEGRRQYARPGKTKQEGISGNVQVQPDGRQTLYVFSSSIGLPVNTSLSAAQYMAYRDFGGDLRQAARHVRTSMMPRREMAPSGYPAAPPAPQQAPAGTSTPPGAPVASVGTELVRSAEVGPPEPVLAFWQRRPELREIWWASQVSAVSPWAVLGYLLAQVGARVGPHVVLPPLGQSGHASLNLLVAISGQSGEGKGEAGKVAKNLIGGAKVPTLKPGTGQGIAAAYTEMTQKDGPVQYNDTGYFNSAEISNLGAHADMQGSNLVGTLCEVYMAEELGEHYAKKELRRPVREGSYRFTLTVGVQPTNAHIILDHAETGLPQRFIWVPAFWEAAILPANSMVPPAPVQPRIWQAWPAILPGSLDPTLDEDLGWQPSDAAGPTPGLSKPKKDSDVTPVPYKEPLVFEYAPQVAREIRMSRRSRQQQIAQRRREGSGGGDLEGHLVLARIKVAAGLALYLDQSTYISEDIWDLSMWVMWVSNDTRIANQRELAAKAQDRNTKKALAEAARSSVVASSNRQSADAVRDQVVANAAARLRVILTAKGGADGWCSVSVIGRAMASKEKRDIKEAGLTIQDILGDMALVGVVDVREPQGAEQGTRYRIRGA